ncbi:hypothetical protein AGMMS50229_02810 [Campylobacterota bacterium]|nr:hypothetical protein AGMMS50229_02810 [Campylobacterota bacterium]
MNKVAIQNAEDSRFSAFWKIYNSSFPLNERRSLDDQIRVLLNSDYCLEVWIDNSETIAGLIGWWNCGDLRFVEHFAISPDFRSAGFGSRFLSAWIAESKTTVLLEIEPITDETTKRRQNFYKRLGFVDNNIVYFQPPYHKTTQEIKLLLMSYPKPISNDCYERFKLKQQTEIMAIFD